MNKLLVIVLLGLIAAASALPRVHKKVPGGGRIVGGEEAKEGELKYQLSLQWSGQHICGASIIKPNVFVTAAHCVSGESPSDITVVAGEHDQSISTGNEQTIQITKIVIHELYESVNDFDNDIALLISEDPAVFNEFIDAVPLPTQGQQTTGDILVSGWGALASGDWFLPDILQKVQIPVVSDEDCQGAYGSDVLETMLCAGRMVEGGQDSCQGDSGGPLVAVDGGYLAGIVSWGYGCAEPGYPGVNTEVAYFVDWIETNSA